MAEEQIQQQPTISGERLGSIDPALSMRLTMVFLLIGIPVSLFSGGSILVNMSVCAAIALIVWRHGPDVVKPIIALREPLREAVALLPRHKEVPAPEPVKEAEKQAVLPEKRSSVTTMRLDDEENELGTYRKPTAPTNFSRVLITFTPSLASVYLGTLLDGTEVYSDAKGLCHVALGGATGQGKSTLERLLMSQLCAAGASVLLLNPHYTRYDIEKQEDWTPFEPYLLHPPMECRQYEAIEFYLKQVATVLLPKRLEKYAYSQPVGKPYFLVIDELPAIIKKVPNAPEYLEAILREGRKVGIFLITAATDFLVKTIAPQGGGAIRDCYRTAFYVGGDPTTARVLLDVPSSQVQEPLLGKGTVMLRSQNCKQASLARVPYVDNQALYDLLGPSTYIPGEAGADDEDELILEHLSPSSLDTSVLAPSLVTRTQVEPMAAPKRTSTMIMPVPKMSHRERYAKPIATWEQLEREGRANMRNFAQVMDLTEARAYKLLCDMVGLDLIHWERKKTRSL